MSALATDARRAKSPFVPCRPVGADKSVNRQNDGTAVGVSVVATVLSVTRPPVETTRECSGGGIRSIATLATANKTKTRYQKL